MRQIPCFKYIKIALADVDAPGHNTQELNVVKWLVFFFYPYAPVVGNIQQEAQDHCRSVLRVYHKAVGNKLEFTNHYFEAIVRIQFSDLDTISNLQI